MNHDENKPDLQTYIEPELEARAVAAVLGEASAFESAELERLIGEKPELGIFKRRIEAVHGLVGQAVRPESVSLRLASERRTKILETIGATAARPVEGDRNAPVLLQLAAIRRKRRMRWIQTYGLAASIAFAVLVLVTLQSSRDLKFVAAKRAELAAPKYREAPTLMQMPALPMAESDDLQMAPPAMIDSVTVPSPRAVGLGSVQVPRFGGADVANRPFIEHAYTQRKLELDAADRERAIQATLASELRRKARPVPADRHNVAEPAAAASHAGAADSGREWAAAAPELSFGDQPVVLSPFEVSAPEERGYLASNTLAGSRVRPLDPNVVGGSGGWISAQANLSAYSGQLAKRKVGDAPVFSPNDGFLFQPPAVAPGIVAQATAADGMDAAAAIDAELSAQKPGAVPAPSTLETPQGEISAAAEPVSTFSLHVSDVSFQLAQAALARGETPDPAQIRPEEFYNAFDYGDPSPAAADKIACRIEQSAHPLLQQRNLVRIAMKVPAAGRGAGQPLHLTVLLDTSGSMERADRANSVQAALGVLASLLTTDDRVTLIGFARQPRLLVEHLGGDQAGKLPELVAATPFAGGTNIEEALKLAGEVARRHHDPAAQNRIVLITDGAANLGNAEPAQLATMIDSLRQQGVAFDACGVGTDGLNDAVLEALTRKGDGRYYILDSANDADAGFARQLAGAFRPAAENIKVQVRFNPGRVGSYRLIGFEQHRLREEDFRNDQVDAAELAAEEAAVALYQVEVLPEGEGELGEVFARFRDAATGQMVERSWTMLHEPHAPAFDRAPASLQLAGTAALMAEKLRGGEMAELIDLGELATVVNRLRGHYAHSHRVQQLVAMFEQLRRTTDR